jgi:spore maturation protein CgeB
MLRVLFVGMRYDYGDPRRGDCYEYVNFYDTLSNMQGVKATFFPFDIVLRQRGRRAMNEDLLKMVESSNPQIVFFVLFTDEFEPKTIRRISSINGARTLNWFTDDHWRFESFSRHWTPYFDAVATTDAVAIEKYHASGLENVIKTQWGFNPFRYRVAPGSDDGRVTFIGQAHSDRKVRIGRLISAGIPVACWGRGWEGGRLGFEQMVAQFSHSAVNLNFAQSAGVMGWRAPAKLVLNRRADGSIHIRTPAQMMEHIAAVRRGKIRQIKGRVFEIPGARGFLLTERADHIQEYFQPGREIELFEDDRELIDKVHYYLSHPEARIRIRDAGHDRALREHSYVTRFEEIFARMGIYGTV